jgi:hypothetical protein
MRSMIPCPSPNGTNHERLFIVREPLMAMDEALDPDGVQAGAGAQAYEELCRFLADHLSPDDLGEAEVLLRQFVDQSGDIGTDEPPPFPGRPRPGGALSMDEMHRRVAVSAQIRARRVQAQTAALEKRFPDAKRLRVIG